MARILLIIGIWIALLPYLGFPVAFKGFLFVLTGLILMYLGLLFYKQAIKIKKKKMKRIDSFSESMPKTQAQTPHNDIPPVNEPTPQNEPAAIVDTGE